MKPGIVLELFGRAKSHPVRVRGLSKCLWIQAQAIEVAPVRMRGLKLWVSALAG